MKIKIKNKVISSAAKRLSKVIDAKSPLTIMQDFHISVLEDSMTLTAMNPRCVIRERLNIQSDIHENIELAIDGKKFSSIVQKLFGDIEIDINIDKKIMRISYDSGSLKIPFEGVSMFPSIFYPEKFKSFKIDGDVFYSMLDSVASIVKEDTLRPILSNICIRVNSAEKSMDVVAMDTIELRKCSIQLDSDSDFDMLISTSFYDILRPYTKGKEIEIRYDGKRTYVIAGDYYLYDINSEGKYIDYNRLVDKASSVSSIIVDREQFINKLDRIEVVSECLYKLVVNEDESYIENSESLDEIKIKENIDVVEQEGSFNDNFNIKRSIDFFNALDSDNIVINRSESVRCMFVKEQVSDIKKFFLIMSYQTV